MEQALKASNLSKGDLHSVEIIGGTCRIPAVKDRIAAFFGKESCSTTNNFDECIAKGCALQCAMLSPAFKVRDFSVNDVTLYPIALSWSSSAGAEPAAMEIDDAADPDDKPASGSSTVVFGKFNSVPNTKMLTFYRRETFSLSAAYDVANCKLPNGFPPKAAGEDGKVEATKIKVKLRLDIHGCLSLESAQAIEEEEAAPPPPAAPAPPTPPVAGAEAAADGSGAA